MNNGPSSIVEMARQAKNKRTREEAELDNFDEDEFSEAELNEEREELQNKTSFTTLPQVDEDKKRRAIKSELKQYRIKYPDISTDRTTRIDYELEQLSTEELEIHLENMKIEVGLIAPNDKAKSLLGVVGFVCEQYFGMTGFTERLITDPQLIGCIDSYLPISLHWIGIPLLTLFCIGGHISDHVNNVRRALPDPRSINKQQQQQHPAQITQTNPTQNGSKPTEDAAQHSTREQQTRPYPPSSSNGRSIQGSSSGGTSINQSNGHFTQLSASGAN
jgi:hypothetical protein